MLIFSVQGTSTSGVSDVPLPDAATGEEDDGQAEASSAPAGATARGDEFDNELRLLRASLCQVQYRNTERSMHRGLGIRVIRGGPPRK